MTAKSLNREAGKARKREGDCKIKLKNAIEKGDNERAKIFAENAIREHQQELSLLKLSSRMEAVAQRLQQALVLGKVTKSMIKTVDGMDAAFASLDATKISRVMDDFSAAFDEMDVKTAVMGKELDRTMDSTVQVDSVQTLMQQVADEHGLKLSDDLKVAPLTRPNLNVQSEQDLESRLREL